MAPLPILLFGESFWRKVIDLDALAAEGVISPNDLSLFRFVETAEEAWDYVEAWYREQKAPDK
jgi:predicted Rossmann-fold nucleotide-binding protein